MALQDGVDEVELSIADVGAPQVQHEDGRACEHVLQAAGAERGTGPKDDGLSSKRSLHILVGCLFSERSERGGDGE